MSSPSILDKISDQRRLDIAQDKANLPLETLEAQLPQAPKVIDFHARLLASAPMAVIGEIKRASPSRGDIDPTANAGEQAQLYAEGGAAAISVLTEPTWFKGHLNDLKAARQAVAKLGEAARPAILRKDFIFDRYQVYEARVAGADTLLLIVAVLDDEQLLDLLTLSRSLGMEPLVEVNNEVEMARAIRIGARVIGVNNRNLHTFTVDLTTTTELSSMVPADVLLVALSGITGYSDVKMFAEANARAVLVGESLMRSKDKKIFIRQLLGQETS